MDTVGTETQQSHNHHTPHDAHGKNTESKSIQSRRTKSNHIQRTVNNEKGKDFRVDDDDDHVGRLNEEKVFFCFVAVVTTTAFPSSSVYPDTPIVVDTVVVVVGVE